ncbi:bestrophin family ion channel [Novipirellula rosea]
MVQHKYRGSAQVLPRPRLDRRMIKSETQGFIELIKIASIYLVFTSLYACSVLYLEERYGDALYSVPGQIGSVFGLAVAFFLGFRMNSAYDRWWEARKIFGELTNNTRSFVGKCGIYVPSIDSKRDATVACKQLVDLAIAYVRQLKSEMHEVQHPELDEHTKKLFGDNRVDVQNKLTNEILLALAVKVEQTFQSSNAIEKYDLMQHVGRFFDIQGKAERINNTPFLHIYGAFTRIIVISYVILMPFFIGDIDPGGEDSMLELLAIPILVLISTAFLTINRLANLLGEPLSEHRTSVAIDVICQTIVQDSEQFKVKFQPKSESAANEVG